MQDYGPRKCESNGPKRAEGNGPVSVAPRRDLSEIPLECRQQSMERRKKEPAGVVLHNQYTLLQACN